MTDVDLEQWLEQCAASIEPPLKRKKMKRRNGDVTMSIELYRTRFADIFYVEFAIYSDDLQSESTESKTRPIYDWRVTNPSFKRPDGFCPDLPLTNEDLTGLALAKEQVVIQGKAVFEAAHSLPTLMQTLRGQRNIAGVWQGNKAADAQIADRIQAFLSMKGTTS